MKAIQRIIALFLSVMIFVSCASLVSFASGEAKPKRIEDLTITTDNTPNRLKLSWKKQPTAKGYQIFRSTSGKNGTYARVAVVSSEGYTDSGLKDSTTYYYKVRAYAKQNGKNVYGPFAKTDLSTRITKAYAKKLSRHVYKVANDWLHQYWIEWNENEQCESPLSARYTGDPDLCWVYGKENTCFYKLNHPTIKTMKQLKTYLMKTFSKETVDEVTDNYYKEKDKTLYRIKSITGDELPVLLLSKNKVKFSTITDKQIDLILYITVVEYDYDLDKNITRVIPHKESLYYQNGHWVFGENKDGYTWGYGMWFLLGETMQH